MASFLACSSTIAPANNFSGKSPQVYPSSFTYLVRKWAFLEYLYAEIEKPSEGDHKGRSDGLAIIFKTQKSPRRGFS